MPSAPRTASSAAPPAASSAPALGAVCEPRGARAGREALLEGCLEVANERMAGAPRRAAIGGCLDPAGCALVAFGGAGGQLACAVATRVGITRVVIPREPGL